MKNLIIEDHLVRVSFLKISRAKLTFKGWKRFDELQKTVTDSRLVFMAMKYGNEVLDNIFINVIKKADS